jgi:hypothetical protein
MRPSRLSPFLLIALVVAAASSTACKSSEAADTPPPVCTVGPLGASCSVADDCCSANCQLGPGGGICVKALCEQVGAACSVGSDCCEGACVDFTCRDASSCGGYVGDPCHASGDCCTGSCAGPIGAQVCVNPEVCVGIGASCTASKDCCEGECGSGGTCVLPEVRCVAGGKSCTADSQCCSANCASGTCAQSLFCDSVGVACDSSADCCSVRCVSGSCASNACRSVADSCASDGDCCSGVCEYGKCQALGGSSTCKTLGEACGIGGECCSTNCTGGTCMPSSPSGGAPGEICYRDDDCASGMCATPAPGEPGRCADAPGGCGLDGYPCTSDSNCCTRKCVDLGTGATVCQPSGGCRMTGNYCDSTAACCGGTNETDTSLPNTYGIYCDGVGQNPGHPEYDTSKTDNRTCTGGQACNPPGNICGYKASQNCCYEGSGSGKAVCKPDSGGILRCFGGPVNETCPTGWDANDPDCCKEEGAVCQFRDQCCGGTPCVPDSAGVLRCANVSTCLPTGTRGCDAPGADPCCAGASCQNLSEVGFVCAPLGCVGDECTTCRTIGNGCAAAADCCSGVCEGQICRAPCVVETGSCTRNDDCCTGLTCSIEDGKTSGSCVGSGGGGGGEPTCSATGQSCLLRENCCNAGDECTGGVCVTPSSGACVEVEAMCGAGINCCGGLTCVGYDVTESLKTCGSPGAGIPCFCAQVTCAGDSCSTACAEFNQPCSTQVSCCNGYCGPKDGSAGGCTSTNTADCLCRTAG